MFKCYTWFFILSEECRLKVYEDGMLRKIFGPKGEKEEKTEEDCIMT